MDEIQNIGLPTQVMCGSEDIMTPVKYTEYLGSKIKDARVQVIPGGSHYVQLEQYQKVNEQIERFLASLK
jgi:pimeloyl-ACP methyl ester carboxylesterase